MIRFIHRAQRNWYSSRPPVPPDLLTLLRFKGPKFKIKLELHNQGDRALTNLPVAFTYDRDIYTMKKGQFMVSALIPVSLRENKCSSSALRPVLLQRVPPVGIDPIRDGSVWRQLCLANPCLKLWAIARVPRSQKYKRVQTNVVDLLFLTNTQRVSTQFRYREELPT